MSTGPQPGDLIRIRRAYWYASHGDNELYMVTEHSDPPQRLMLIRKANIYGGRSFYGKLTGLPTDDSPERLSTSGGRFVSASAQASSCCTSNPTVKPPAASGGGRTYRGRTEARTMTAKSACGRPTKCKWIDRPWPRGSRRRDGSRGPLTRRSGWPNDRSNNNSYAIHTGQLVRPERWRAGPTHA